MLLFRRYCCFARPIVSSVLLFHHFAVSPALSSVSCHPTCRPAVMVFPGVTSALLFPRSLLSRQHIVPSPESRVPTIVAVSSALSSHCYPYPSFAVSPASSSLSCHPIYHCCCFVSIVSHCHPPFLLFHQHCRLIISSGFAVLPFCSPAVPSPKFRRSCCHVSTVVLSFES